MTADEQTTVNELAREVRAMREAMGHMDTKLDGVISTVDKGMGILALARWLGLTGVVVILVALSKAFGGPL